MTQPPVPDPSSPPPPEHAPGLPAVPVGRQAHLWGIRRAIAVALGGAVGLVGVLVAAALWAAGFPALKRDGTVTAGTLFELLKLVFAVVRNIRNDPSGYYTNLHNAEFPAGAIRGQLFRLDD